MTKRRPLIYVAGPLSPTKTGSPIEYLGNCRRMLAAAVELIKKGYSPFVPALDLLLFLNGEGEEITVDEIRAYSAAWIPVCSAMLLMPGWKESTGTMAELAEATRIEIPAFESIDRLVSFFGGPEI